MPEKKPPHSLKPLLIATGLLTSAILVGSYMLFSPSHDAFPTAANNTALPKGIDAASTNAAAEDKHLNPDIVPDFLNAVNKQQLLALLPEVSPEDDLAVQDRQPLTLWQPVEQDNATADPDQLRIETVASDPALLEKLEVGRKIEFVIPQTGEALSGQTNS